MKISLKKFSNDPYKYAKKAPIILMLGDEHAYALIPYITYKEHFLDKKPLLPDNQPLSQTMPQKEETKRPHGWLYNLLFS